MSCHASHPAEMSLSPSAPFMLPAGAASELHVGVRPLVSGTRFLYVNVVDSEYHQLLRSWLICVNTRPPNITKVRLLLHL